MIDLDGNILTSREDLLDYLAAKRLMPGYKPPFADLGYCLCGTVWIIEAMAELNFPHGACPDCGEEADAIERSLAEESAA